MSDNPVFERIQEEVDSADVVLFMKGSPVFPQCGFSAATVQALTLLGVKFKGIDVLQDSEIRDGIKEFTNWPTIPQLYVKGEFVGGCDIVREMYETGELRPVLFRQRRRDRAERSLIPATCIPSSFGRLNCGRFISLNSKYRLMDSESQQLLDGFAPYPENSSFLHRVVQLFLKMDGMKSIIGL